MRWQRKKELGAEHKQGADAGRCTSLEFLKNGLKGHFLWYMWQRFDFGEIDDMEKTALEPIFEEFQAGASPRIR